MFHIYTFWIMVNYYRDNGSINDNHFLKNKISIVAIKKTRSANDWKGKIVPIFCLMLNEFLVQLL